MDAGKLICSNSTFGLILRLCCLSFKDLLVIYLRPYYIRCSSVISTVYVVALLVVAGNKKKVLSSPKQVRYQKHHGGGVWLNRSCVRCRYYYKIIASKPKKRRRAPAKLAVRAAWQAANGNFHSLLPPNNPMHATSETRERHLCSPAKCSKADKENSFAFLWSSVCLWRER
jgi:hypothetical protein